tara:strand:+ start:921 stop:1454 length:534 start_codon:yes stop_codon:yes gene_type:complete
MASEPYQLISRNTLSGTASDITFSSIPSTFEHLQIKATMRGDVSADGHALRVQMGNSSVETGSIYNMQYLWGSSNTFKYSTATANSTYFNFYDTILGANATAGRFGFAVITILDYLNTSKNTSFIAQIGNYGASDKRAGLYGGVMDFTSAIDIIKMYPQTGDFVANTDVALYGIKSS